jgi:hypothetical protein
MSISQKKHIEFYNLQIESFEEEWKRYATSPMKILIHEKRLFVGRIWGIQENQGNVILRFKSGAVPRMKQPYILCMVSNEAPQKSDDWDFSYMEFRQFQNPRLSGKSTEVHTKYYLKSEESNWSFIAVSGFENELLMVIKEKSLSNNIHPLIILAESDPPVDYLLHLRDFVEDNGSNLILNLDQEIRNESWSPINLDNENDVLPEIVNKIEKVDTVIIQGPPGTGKSYLTAKLFELYLAKNYSIVATTLTNSALIEIAEKRGLQNGISNGKVFKTNLSSDENKKLPKLRSVESFTPINGELLLTTYYKLSQKYQEILLGSKRFDLLVIEEASQAFLATIAMFSTLAKKVLLIGDHKQLTPVVINRSGSIKIDKNISAVIDGLKTYAFNNNGNSYRLTKTRRLTSDASKLTGMFYENTLTSISENEGQISIRSGYKQLFHHNGGITIAKLPFSKTDFKESDIISFMCKMAIDLLSNDKSIEVALLSPYVKVESSIYEKYSRVASDYTRLTINTIHKIQGLTTDITILYLPLDNPAFDLDDNLFNVATSRAKKGTLIITYDHVDLLSSISQETLTFLHSCNDVSAIFRKYLKDVK